MKAFLKNTRGHANPISIALNIATIVVGLTVILFNPKFLPVKGIVLFAGFLLIIQMIHIVAFGTKPVSMILAAFIILASAVVLKIGLGGSRFVMENTRNIIIGLLVLYLIREVAD